MDAMGSAPSRAARTAVREIDETTYWGYLRTSPHAGFQQSPEQERARSGDGRPELVGRYDDAGVASTLEADGPEAGLLQFKADMGAEFRECIGGWELVLDPFLRTVFTLLLPLHGRARRLADQASRTIRARTW